MTIKNYIQLVEQADIPNMQIIGELGDGFANIRYNGMAGVLDQQSNKMILISQKVPDAYQIVTVTGGRESTDYVGADQIGPATKKALDSIIPRQRPRPPAPLPVKETYESNDQVRSIVQRMMEDTRVPQKPRQGPLRPQTGAGKHKDKKKDQKQGKEKHKSKNLDENSIPFAGLGKHKIGQAGQLRSPGPTGYPKGKLVGGAAESRFGRDRDPFYGGDDFRNRERNVGVENERNNYQVVVNGKLWKVFADRQQAINIARSLQKKGKDVEVFPTGAPPSESISEASKKPNATTRNLRDYPVSDKDVAKPVKPEKKKDEKKSVEEAHPNSKIYDKCWSGYKKVPGKKRGEAGSCKKMESISEGILVSYGLMEKSPPGFKGTVKAMKKHPELTKGKTKDGKEKNPWALAWHMKNKGYKSHKKADGSNKD